MLRHCSSFVFTALLVSCGLLAQPARAQFSSLHNDSRVTPVSGQSWLIHLNRSFNETSMGKTGRLGPGPDEVAAFHSPSRVPIFSSKDGMVLHGSDLYRLNCQGCHGEQGLGAPPEINSLIGPVRATSPRLVVERMKKAGVDMSYSEASKLAQQSKVTLLERLHKGGESMPAFPQLNEAEIRALLSYVEHLAEIPGAGSDQAIVRESSERVGELIVKSTCHTCHSAAGADPGHVAMLDGAIPPLCTLTQRKSEPEFIRKVTKGAPVEMGSPPMLFRGRMPVFFYLSEEEAADVYLYLTLDPPDAGPTDDRIVGVVQHGQPGSSAGPGLSAPTLIASTLPLKADSDTGGTSPVQSIALPVLMALMTLVLAGGLSFTFREFHRLASHRAGSGAAVGDLHPGPIESDTTFAVSSEARSLLFAQNATESQHDER
jgi:mono/diheme cytochrome c family protein